MGTLAQLTSGGYREVLDHLPVATYLVDANRRIVLWNDACEILTGHRREEVLGHRCADNLLAHCDESCRPKCGDTCPLLETMRDGHPRHTDVFLRHKAGHRIPVRVRAAPVRDEHGVIVGACEAMEERFMALPIALPLPAPPEAALDAATELPSRHAVLDRLAAELQAFAGERVPFGVMCLAIDNFTTLCAADGAIAAKKVLFETAQTMSRLVGPGNFVGRWADGIFMVTLRGCSETSLLGSAVTLERLAGMEAVPWWGDYLTITLSAGGTVSRPGDTVEELIDRAEGALMLAVKMGDNQAVVV